MPASCARGAEGVAVEPEARRLSLGAADAGPLGIELVRALSVATWTEDVVDGFGDEGVPVDLRTIGFATAHNASRFLRLAA